MSMTPLRPQSLLLLTVPALLVAGIAFSQEKSDRPPWARKPKSTASASSTSKPSTSSTSTTAPTSAPDSEPGKIVLPTPPAPANDPQDPVAAQRGRIRVNVNLVNVLVSVLDDKNRPAPDLPREAFQLFEEGVEQKIDKFEPETSQPLDLAIMIDSSLSAHKEISFEQEAAAQKAVPPKALLYPTVTRPVKNESGRNPAGEHALETMTDTTGGAMFYPDTPQELGAIFDRIDRDPRPQYLLAYYPTPRGPANTYRSIVVTVNPANYQVRHRRSYLTGPQ